ncbi:hypothetical protein P3T29_000358 [Kitasatospora sp. MAP5-34]|nr:hypothetical protein [Kitasatospora sp. MAP5-34]
MRSQPLHPFGDQGEDGKHENRDADEGQVRHEGSTQSRVGRTSDRSPRFSGGTFPDADRSWSIRGATSRRAPARPAGWAHDRRAGSGFRYAGRRCRPRRVRRSAFGIKESSGPDHCAGAAGIASRLRLSRPSRWIPGAVLAAPPTWRNAMYQRRNVEDPEPSQRVPAGTLPRTRPVGSAGPHSPSLPHTPRWPYSGRLHHRTAPQGRARLRAAVDRPRRARPTPPHRTAGRHGTHRRPAAGRPGCAPAPRSLRRRIGVPGSTLFGVSATASADGAGAASYDGFSSLGGGVLLAAMMPERSRPAAPAPSCTGC